MAGADRQAKSAVRWKLKRVRQGGPIRVLDLFSGCGGFSLGFQKAEFSIVGGAENDPVAACTFAANLFRNSLAAIQQLHATPRDLRRIDAANLVAELGLGPSVSKAVDVIIAGPPCQAYARVGRAKLRHLHGSTDAYRRDPRADLYLRLLDYVAALRPLAVAVENVPDALNCGGCNTAEEICEALDCMGYVSAYTLLNAVYYGVPQMRERMFLLGIHEAVRQTPCFPQPTHWWELPRGYHGSRTVALKAVAQETLFGWHSHYLEPPPSLSNLPCAVSARDAIGDLPPIFSHRNGGMTRGPRRFAELVKYDGRRRVSDYAAMMREWPGLENSEGIRDHVIRWLPRDYAIFERMSPGDEYPQAHQIAMRILQEKQRRRARRGMILKPGTPDYQKLMRETVPPYDPGKFPNKWWKLKSEEPVRTLLAHLERDSYTHIHYDSSQSRTISVREAARLQSFPDGFVFSGCMNAAFRQIGNAVSPLLAWSIATTLKKLLLGTNRCGKR